MTPYRSGNGEKVDELVAQKSDNGRIIRGGRRVMRTYVKVMVILCLVTIIGLIGCNLLSDSGITIYRARVHNGKLIIGNRTTFRVSVDRQEIIYWSPDVKHPPRRLKDCVVLTRNNWSGKYIDGSGSVFMGGERFYEYPSNPDIIYVSRWRWWFIKIKGWLVG